MRILHENPELHGAKRRFLPFLCIAERVTVRGATLFSRAVNSNTLRAQVTNFNIEKKSRPDSLIQTAFLLSAMIHFIARHSY